VVLPYRRSSTVLVNDELSQRLRELHAEAYLRRHETVVPLTGARELLAHPHERQVPFAIATSGARHIAGSALALLGLPDDVPVVTRDLAERPIPTRTPSSLRPAGDPPHCFVVGASVGDLLAAQAGRCPGHRTALGWLRPQGALAVGRVPRLRRPGRDADTAGGGRRPAHPTTAAATAAVASRVEHMSNTVL
jgi:phosphoglycolate phosphatase-like HAD superfamily hydrolase